MLRLPEGWRNDKDYHGFIFMSAILFPSEGLIWDFFFLIDHIVFSALMSLHIIFILSTWNTTCDHSSSSPSSLTFFPIFFPFLNWHVLWIQSYTIETDVIFI